MYIANSPAISQNSSLFLASMFSHFEPDNNFAIRCIKHTFGKDLVVLFSFLLALQACAKEPRLTDDFVFGLDAELNVGQLEPESLDDNEDDIYVVCFEEVFGELDGDCLEDADTGCNDGK
jgi:hypothetical protein